MMRNSTTMGALALGLAYALGVASPSWAADESTRAGDDKCVQRCDEESDKCMLDAGKDQKKRQSCDANYSECLQKCG